MEGGTENLQSDKSPINERNNVVIDINDDGTFSVDSTPVNERGIPKPESVNQILDAKPLLPTDSVDVSRLLQEEHPDLDPNSKVFQFMVNDTINRNRLLNFDNKNKPVIKKK